MSLEEELLEELGTAARQIVRFEVRANELRPELELLDRISNRLRDELVEVEADLYAARARAHRTEARLSILEAGRTNPTEEAP